jgi:fermentation-respiration switch protein FrsA (DUF1100 family)
MAPKWTPELNLRGSANFAPGSHIGEAVASLEALNQPSPLTGLAALIARGLEIADPDLKLGSLLSDKAAALYPQTLTRCVPDLTTSDSFGGIAPSELFRDGADLSAATKAANANDPEDLKLKPAPVLVEQGSSDTTVLPPFTDSLVKRLRDGGAKARYKRYESVGHADIVSAAADDATAWIAARLK